MIDDLSNMTASDIDALPFGYIALALDGTVRKYNRYEADLARRDPKDVLGRNFFRDVAPCTQVQEFEGRFQEFVNDDDAPSTMSFEFEFRFRHGSQKVLIGFVRTPLEREVIVTVNRRRERALALSTELTAEPARGALVNAAGQRVVTCGPDFWLALESLFEGGGRERRAWQLRRIGRAWARRHLDRVEGLIQREHGKALREVELQLALEALSGSLGSQGLGLFEVDFSGRDAGILVIEHRFSPFAAAAASDAGGHDGGGACQILAGHHAGFLSPLAGRELVGREIECSHKAYQPCRILVSTEERLSRLTSADEGPDVELRRRLGLSDPQPAEAESPEERAVELAGDAA